MSKNKLSTHSTEMTFFFLLLNNFGCLLANTSSHVSTGKSIRTIFPKSVCPSLPLQPSYPFYVADWSTRKQGRAAPAVKVLLMVGCNRKPSGTREEGPCGSSGNSCNEAGSPGRHLGTIRVFGPTTQRSPHGTHLIQIYLIRGNSS